MDIENPGYVVGCDAYHSESLKSAATFITIDEVVRSFLKDRPIIDYQAGAAYAAHFFRAGIIGDIRGPAFYNNVFVEIEDAEVVSVETVSKA